MADLAKKQSATKTAELPSKAAVVIVGGGIAGLASAWQLAALGVRDVLLLEGESELATHASARNAGIFLPLEESLSAVWLANRSRDLLDARMGTSWLSALGVSLLAAQAHALDELKFAARRLGVFHEHWAADALAQNLPSLRDGDCTQALHLPLGGVIDIALVLSRLRQWALAGGVRIVTGARVAGIELARKRVSGVRLEDGRKVESERVLLAAGAWAGQLGRAAGSPLALTPMRRHLVHLVSEHMPSRQSPVAWRIDQPFYFRPEEGGILASPCDETPSEPGVPDSDADIVAGAQLQLQRLAPKLAVGARLERSWACLRTMSADRELTVGPDDRVKGLYWCAGLGGRGMTCGVAAGELLARSMLGLAHPLQRPLSPNRFL